MIFFSHSASNFAAPASVVAFAVGSFLPFGSGGLPSTTMVATGLPAFTSETGSSAACASEVTTSAVVVAMN